MGRPAAIFTSEEIHNWISRFNKVVGVLYSPIVSGGTCITIGGAGYTTLLKFDADATTAIEFTTTCSPTTFIKVSGDATTVFLTESTCSPTDVFKIEGDATTVLNITSTCTPTTGVLIAGVSTDGISITSACVDGIQISGDCTATGINISATGIARAIMVGAFGSASNIIVNTTNNYPVGVFAKINADINPTADIRCAWFRLRVDTNVQVGSNANWGNGLKAIQGSLKLYGGTGSAGETGTYCWVNCGVFGSLETDGATKVAFKDGSVSAAVFAHVGLLASSSDDVDIETGAVVAGVAVNAGTAANTTVAGDFAGVYIYQDVAGGEDFASGVLIDAASCIKGVNVKTCLNPFYSVFNYTASIGTYMQGIKIEHTRASDIIVATSGVWGAQIVVNQGTGYSSKMAPSIWGLQVVIKGDSVHADTNTYGLVVETQTSGKTRCLERIALNTGGVCDVGLLDIAVFATTPATILLSVSSSAVVTSAIVITDVNAGGTFTNLIDIQYGANTTNFLKAAAANGCIDSTSGGDNKAGRIVCSIAGQTRYIYYYTD